MRTIVFLIGLILPSPAFAQVVISEVMWAGSERSTADEWLEMTNISDETVLLDGWTILKRGSDGSDTVMIAFPEDAEISAGQYFLIANYTAEKSDLDVSPDIVSTAVSLANSKLYLQILNKEGEVIDAVDDGSGSPFAGGKSPFASMERVDLFGDGTDPSNWRTAEVSDGFDEGVEVRGTPGKEAKEAKEEKETKDFSASSTSLASLSSLVSLPSFVRITEVLLDPADSEDYEWIELGNLGEESTDITGWILSDGARSYSVEPRSNSGYILAPGEHTLFFHYQTGIALKASGEVITLFDGDQEIDRIDVSETGEEISFGREADGSRGPFCVPTPRKPNQEILLHPIIKVQSGRSTDYTKVTLNLEAEVSEGSLKDAQCFWDFKDGTHSKKCNPPSHSWDNIGVYNIELLVTTKCGNEIRKGMDVVVLEKRKSKQSRKSTISQNSSISSISSMPPQPPQPPQLPSSSLPATRNPPSYAKASAGRQLVTPPIIEQKMYSINSSTFSTSTRTNDILPIRYKNIPQYPVSSVSSDSSFPSYSSAFSFTYRTNEPTNQRSESGLPWTLLFSQSVLWLILVGKKMI